MKLHLTSLHTLFGGLCALAAAAGGAQAAPWSWNSYDISISAIGRHTNNAPFDRSAAEIVTHDPATQRLLVGNARDKAVDVLDIQNPANPVKVASIDLSTYGAVVNSVAVHHGLIAIAVEANVKTDPGLVVLFDRDLNFLNAVQVGALPDMVVFSPNGRWLLCANEGEPNTYNNFGMISNGPSIDPEGSISIIDVDSCHGTPVVRTATFTAFNGGVPAGIRVYGPGATVAQDMEPEYITISDDSRTAYVTLQENNALAVVNISAAVVTRLIPLGYKNHNLPGYGLDPSDQDGGIKIQPWPLHGIFCPDSIASYKSRGRTYLVTANEGDTREWPGFREDVRLSTRTLDTNAFPDAAFLKANTNLGRLAVSSVDGDIDGDGDLDEIYSYGGRSFSIWTTSGQLVFDSGDQLEQLTAALYPTNFNASHGNNTFDGRSPSKGPEPEGVAIGNAYGRTLAFIGMERIGGIAVYDITNPTDPFFEDYVNTRTFAAPFNFATAGDLGPEGLKFIPGYKSPNGKPLLVAAHEVSGSTVIYQINRKRVWNFPGPWGDDNDDE